MDMDEALRRIPPALLKSWRSAGFYPGRPLASVFSEAVTARPATKFHYWSDGALTTLTAEETWREAHRAAAGMRALGLRAGDVLVAQLPNCREYAATFLAATLLDLVFVPVVHIYGAQELGFILRESRAKALVMPRQWRKIDYRARLEAVGSLPALEHLIIVGENSDIASAVSWEALTRAGPEGVAPSRPNPERPHSLYYTSGTSSAPKGAIHTHRSLLAEVDTYRAFTDHTRGPVLGCMPAGHVGGVLLIMRVLLLGHDGVFMDAWNASEGVELIQRFGIGWSNLGPFHLTGILEEMPAAGLPNFRIVAVGGTSVSPELIKWADERGIVASRSYGATEHPTMSLPLPTDSLDKRANTDGRLLPGTAMRLVDDDGRDVPVGEPGEILVMGSEQMSGYWNATLDAAAFTPDGWFRIGDVGMRDGEGFIRIVDRKKDIIIRGGENISSKEVEDLLHDLPQVAACAVVGWPDVRYGERVCAVIQLDAGSRLAMPEVAAHFAAAGVARQKTPERLFFVDELPRNAQGKVLKAEVRRTVRGWYEAEAPGGTRS